MQYNGKAFSMQISHEKIEHLIHNQQVADLNDACVLVSRHGDWNLVPCRRAGVRGGSRSLGRLRIL